MNIHTLPITQKSNNFSSNHHGFPPIRTLAYQIGVNSLKQLPCAIGYSLLGCYFVASPLAGAALVGAGIGCVVVSNVFRQAFEVINPQIQEELKDKSLPKLFRNVFSTLPHLLNMGKRVSLGLLDIAIRVTLIHELGHALMTRLLLVDPQPRITLFPLTGGVTRFHWSDLTPIGESIGHRWTEIAISGGGAAFESLSACVDLIASHLLRKSHPEVSRQLKCQAIMSVVQPCFYALSAYWDTKTNGHDFVSLWSKGIHPVAAIVMIVALPVITHLTINGLQHLIDRHAQRNSRLLTASV